MQPQLIALHTEVHITLFSHKQSAQRGCAQHAVTILA